MFAGAGASWLASVGSRAALLALVGLLGIAAVDSVPLTWRARDVLPTSAHRWIADHTAARVMDCADVSDPDAQAQLPWLMEDRLALRDGGLANCADPMFAPALAALGYGYAVLSGGPMQRQAREMARTAGLTLVRTARDAQVFAVTKPSPVVATTETLGFHEGERDEDDAWRAMGQAGWWRVINTSAASMTARLEIDLSAYPGERYVQVTLDDGPLERITDIATVRSLRTVGPMLLTPGPHRLGFRSVATAVPSDAIMRHDDAPLTLRVWRWHWDVSAP